MASSALPDAIDWCVDTFRAAATLGADDPAVLVLDGPEPVDLSVQRVLWVGVSEPDLEEPSDGASGDQDWAGLGALRKDEMLSIAHAARAWTGDADIRAARRAAFEIVAAVEDIVRASANLGGTVLVTLPGVTNLGYRAAVGKSGAIAQVTFDIVAKARI